MWASAGVTDDVSRTGKCAVRRKAAWQGLKCLGGMGRAEGAQTWQGQIERNLIARAPPVQADEAIVQGLPYLLDCW